MNLFNRVYYKLVKIFSNGEKYATTTAIKKARNLGVKVGDDCRFFSTSFSTEPYLIEIGNHVTITTGVKFITHDGGVWVLRYMDKELSNVDLFGKIKIKDNVFIGLDSIILPGITLGNNIIVAAGSVVTKSFDGNQIIGGVPAKPIKNIEEYIKAIKPNLLNTKKKNYKEKRKIIFENMNNLKSK